MGWRDEPRGGLAQRCYRALLLAYPSSFRSRYGEEAVALFGELHEDARRHGIGAVVRLWARTAVAVLAHGVAERWSEIAERSGDRRVSRSVPGAAVDTSASRLDVGARLHPRAIGARRDPRRSSSLRHLADVFASDVRLAVRSLRRRPSFALATAGLIGLGVGAATAVYSVVDSVLLRPLPYPDASRLVTFAKGSSQVPVPDYEDWRDGTRSFDAWAASWDVSAVLTGVGEPARIETARVTPGLLPLLGARAHRGRLFDGAEGPGSPAAGLREGRPGERAGASPTVVLSHTLWRTRFGAEDAMIGRTILLNDQPFTVIGVLDADYTPPEALSLDDVDAYVALDLRAADVRRRDLFILSVLAKLAPESTPASARSELSLLARRMADDHGDTWRGSDGEPVDIVMTSLETATVGDIGGTLYMFLAAVGLMLLIACANVANLALARATERDHETAIHTALGASRGRVVSSVLAESLVLGLAGGLLGMGLAWIGVQTFRALDPGGIPRVVEVGIDARILVFASALSVGTALVFGLAPAVTSASVSARAALGKAGRSLTAGRGRARLRGGLIVTEIGLALTLLASAAVLFHGFVRLRSEPLGFEPASVMTARLDVGNAVAADGRAAFAGEVLRRIEATPGVRAAGASWQLPFARGRCCFRSNAWAAAGSPGDTVSPYIHPVTDDYFSALGLRVVEGRVLSSADATGGELPPPGSDDAASRGAPPPTIAAVINRRVAERLWPDGSAIGRRFRVVTFDATEFEVVGVVEPVLHWSIATGAGEDVYVPMQAFASWLGLLDIAVRHDGPPAPIARAIRDAVHAGAPDLPLDAVEPMESRVARSVATPRFFTTLLLAFAAIALLLAAAGVYGTVLHSVGQRRREFGIRVALGAKAHDLTRLVLGGGLILVGAGVAAGLAGAFAFTRVLNSLVYEVSVLDPTSVAAAAAVIAAAALLACWVPARRAGRADPMRILRAE